MNFRKRGGLITRQYEATCDLCPWSATFGSLDPANNIYAKAQVALVAHLEAMHGLNDLVAFDIPDVKP